MPRIKVDPDGILSVRGMFQREAGAMDDVKQTISRVLSDLDMKVASSEGIRAELTALRQRSQRNSQQIEGMAQTLDQVNNAFVSTDRNISKEAEDIQYTADWILTSLAVGGLSTIPLSLFHSLVLTDEISELFGGTGGSSVPFPLDSLLEDSVGLFSEIESNMGDVKKLTDIFSVFSDNELAEYLGKYAKGIGDNTVLKVSSYLDDGKDLLEAWSSGDSDTVLGLVEKYAKKGVKFVTGFKSPVASIYLDLGWNIGENLTESVEAFMEDPSLGTLLSGVWNTTGGAVIETGVGLASDTLDFLYGLVGADFDEEDFNNAVDYLGDAVVGGLTAAGEVVADGILAAGEAIADGVEAVGDAVGDFVESGAELISDGWNVVTDWFGSWF